MDETLMREAAIFSAARRLPVKERAFYLDEACAGDALLRRQIEELLEADESAGAFLLEPAAGAEGPARAGAGLDPEATLRVTPSSSEQPGDTIDRYKLMEKVGEGGFGAVYVAEQKEPVKRRVALKIIKLGMDTQQVVARFEAERQALAMMDHPNIAKVLDAGSTQTGRPYFVMELVRGIRITDYCDQANLTTKERLGLFIQVCQAIQHAHQKGIIHRDIKPSNILVTLHDGVPVPKVIDFGIAKATEGRLSDATVYTQLHQFIGTPAYMSPEQAEMSGLDIDTRSDIYSMGVLLYELLVGRTPFDAQELMSKGVDAMRKIIREKEPLRPSTRVATLGADELTTTAKRRSADTSKLLHQIRGDLDWIVMKCLEKDRSRRYETANGVAVDLKRHLNNEPVSARPPSNLYRFQKAFRRNKLTFAATGAVAFSIVLGLISSNWQAHVARVARREAEAARKVAEGEKERANSQASEATAQRQLAQDAEAAARRQVVRMTVANGVRLHEEGQIGEALLWFARLVSLVERDSTEERLHRLRFASVMGECPRLEQIFQHDGFVAHVEFSPRTARYVVTTCVNSPKGWARVWDTVTGDPVTPALHGGKVWGASFSPDGRSVVTASSDYTARVWDASTGRPVTPPLQHSNQLRSAIFSPDGEQVLTASLDQTAQLWNARTGKPVPPPFRHGEAVGLAVFSPDGSRIATAGWGSTAKVWDAKTGLLLSPPLKHGAAVNSVIFFPDGQRVLTASWDRTVRIWDALSGQPIGEPMKHKSGVITASLNSDGSKVATREADQIAHVWEVATGNELISTLFKDDQMGNWGRSFLPSFSPDGQFFVTVDKNHAACLIDSNTGAPFSMPLQHNGPLLDAAFSSDSHRLVTSSMDGTARVWDIPSTRETNSKPRFRFVINRAPQSHDGKRVIIPRDDRNAQVLEATTGKPVAVLMIPDGPLSYAEFSSDDRFIVTVSSRMPDARVWNAETGAPLTPPLHHEAEVHFAFFSPDGQRIVTSVGSQPGTASIFQTATGRRLGKKLEHQDYIEQASFSPDSTRVVTASADATARVWSATTGEAITPAMKHASGVAFAAFSPDGRLIVTASYDRTARVWDATTGEPLSAPFRHSYPVRLAAFSSDSQRIITACEDGLRTWKLATDDRPVADLEMLAQVLTGKQIDAGGATSFLRAEEVRASWLKLRSKYPGDSLWNGGAGLSAEELSSEEQSHLNDSLSQIQRARNLAAASAKFEPFPIDLSRFYNGRLTNDWMSGDPGQATPGLSGFPLGLHKFADVSFDARGVVQLSGGLTKTYGPECPDEIRNIPVNRKCHLIHFLHGAFDSGEDQRLGSYILRFAGGLAWEIPILGGYDVHSLDSLLTLESPKHSVVAWTGKWGRSGDPARLFRTTWENPWPDRPLESVDFIGNMAFGAPFLVGITVE